MEYNRKTIKVLFLPRLRAIEERLNVLNSNANIETDMQVNPETGNLYLILWDGKSKSAEKIVVFKEGDAFDKEYMVNSFRKNVIKEINYWCNAKGFNPMKENVLKEKE